MLRRMFMQGTAVLATALCGMRSRTQPCSLEFTFVNVSPNPPHPYSTPIITVTGSVEELKAFGYAYQESLWPEWKEEVAIIEASPAGRVSRIGKESLLIHRIINDASLNGEMSFIISGQRFRDAFQAGITAVPGSLDKVPSSVRWVVGLPFKSLGPMSSVGYMNHAPR